MTIYTFWSWSQVSIWYGDTSPCADGAGDNRTCYMKISDEYPCGWVTSILTDYGYIVPAGTYFSALPMSCFSSRCAAEEDISWESWCNMHLTPWQLCGIQQSIHWHTLNHPGLPHQSPSITLHYMTWHYIPTVPSQLQVHLYKWKSSLGFQMCL